MLSTMDTFHNNLINVSKDRGVKSDMFMLNYSDDKFTKEKNNGNINQSINNVKDLTSSLEVKQADKNGKSR